MTVEKLCIHNYILYVQFTHEACYQMISSVLKIIHRKHHKLDFKHSNFVDKGY